MHAVPAIARAVGVALAVGEGERVAVGVSGGVPVQLVVCEDVSVPEMEGESVPESVGVGVPEGEGVVVRDSVDGGVTLGEGVADADGTASSVSVHAALARTTRKPAPNHGPGTTTDATDTPAASTSDTVAAPVHAGPAQPAHVMFIVVTARDPPAGHVPSSHGDASEADE